MFHRKHIKKALLFLIIVAFFNLVSCTEQGIVNTDKKEVASNETIDIENDIEISVDPEMAGILHNEILSEFNNRHTILSGPLDEDTFIRYYQESVNTVFKRNGIRIIVSKDEIRSDLLMLREFTESGVFNFFSPPRETNIEPLISHGIVTGKLTQAESEYIRKLFNSLKNGVLFSKDSAQDQLLSSEFESIEDIDKDMLVSIECIAQSTSEFWSEFLIHSLPDGEIYILYKDDEYVWRKTCDICGGIMGIWAGGPGGAIILGGLASIAFHVVYNDGQGWWDTVTGWF